MTREEFESLVRRVEARHDGSGRKLRFSVVLLALLSYASLFAWLAVAFVIAVPFVWGGLAAGLAEGGWLLLLVGALVAAAGIVTTLAVLRVRIEPPEGLEIRRADAPDLFAMLDELRARLRSARVHRTVLSWDCNAGVSAIPRLGLLGWPRHHLEIGLPLLEVLSVDELRGVLAHELAHISAQHGRLGGWIYRLRRSWMQAFAQLERSGGQRVSVHSALRKFFGWFWPRFSAHAFVLSRLNEFEADAVAARLGGPGQMASALLGIKLYNRLLGELFWPELWRGVSDEPEPPADVFRRLRVSLDAGVPASRAGQWMHEAYRVFTTHEDTHPCLTERLRAMGQEKMSEGWADRFPPPARPSAAAVLFGERLEEIQGKLAGLWRAASRDHWQTLRAKSRVFEDQTAAQARRTAQAAQAAQAVGNLETLWERAHTTAEIHGAAQAEPLLRQVLALRPTHPAANFLLGRHLLSAGDAAGELHLERAMTADEDFVPAAAGTLSEHFTRNGETGRVRELRVRMDRYDARVAASRAERNRVTPQDRFLPHELASEALAATCVELRKEPEVAQAFLARKELQHFPEQRLFVLVIRVKRRWYALPSAEKESAVVGRLVARTHLPGRLLVVGEHGGFAGVARKVKGVPGGRIYEASGEGEA